MINVDMFTKVMMAKLNHLSVMHPLKLRKMHNSIFIPTIYYMWYVL